MNRYQSDQIKKDLARKMVFLGGPRRVGKTTLAQTLLTEREGYLNWDAPEHREKILKRQLPSSPPYGFLTKSINSGDGETI